MNKYLHFKKYSVLLLFVLLSMHGIIAQSYTKGVLDGVVRVKLKPELVTGAKGLNITTNKKIALSGIDNVDKLNTQFSAVKMRRVFPYSAKNEAKHQKHGLHLWYEIEFDNSSIATMSMGGESSSIAVAKAYAGISEIEVAEAVREISLVEPYTVRKADISTAESNSITTTSSSDFNDPLLYMQWHYDNFGQTGGTPGADINLFDAWTIESGNTNVIVSVHDEGIDVNHEDLAGAMWVNEAELNGEEGVDDDGNGYIDDIYGYNFSDDMGQISPGHHGTHVGGTVGAISNNGKGVAGVAGGSGSADGVRLMSCMIIGGKSVNLIPNSYIYAADNGAVISQNSWGYNVPGVYEQVIHDAIDYFIAEAGDYTGSPMKGGIVIFAAGNDNSSQLYYPGAYEPCFTVAALDAFSHKASFSNFGEWVDIAAPGGDETDNVAEDTLKSSILSCYPYNEYGYMDGTSQACPHVSGVAALVVSKYGGEDFTNTKLESHLRTGIKDNIYSIPENESYSGQLGVGLTDAALALDYDYQLAPNRVNDLAFSNVAQDVVSLQWTVPADEDDGAPYFFEIFYSTDILTESTLDDVKYIKTRNILEAGETFVYDVPNLFSTTEYHFLVRAIDRWGNLSALSNQVDTITTEGPLAVLDSTKGSIDISIDVTQDSIGLDSIMLYNYGEGVLRWDATPRHIEAIPLSAKPNLNYPQINLSSDSYPRGLKSYGYSPEIEPQSIQDENDEEYSYLMENDYQFMVIGETDPDYPNSAATRFEVNDPEGFNLTHIEAFIVYDIENGPVILEIYSGENIETADLLLAQEINENPAGGLDVFVELDYHLFFEQGSTFWVVYHVPQGNMYPLVAGVEADLDYSKNCYYSWNLGDKWAMNEEIGIDKQYIWVVWAMSEYLNVGEYIMLTPESGEVAANDSVKIVGKVNASEMINGEYQGLITFNINEPGNSLLKLPANISVVGQVPEIKSANRVDYSSVMIGTDKTLTVELRNEGFGRFELNNISIDNPQFEYISGHSENFEAGTAQNLKFKFTPTTIGNSIGNVTLEEASGRNYTIQLFGVGFEPPVASLEPEADTFNVAKGYNLNIGDTISGSFILHNTGKYPLDYFMPAFSDGSNMEEVSGNVHKFGYITRVDEQGVEPAYIWDDISETGINVTDELIGGFDHTYYETEIGFEFPFFGKKESNAFISRHGLVSFDKEDVLWQAIPMYYKQPNSPERFISAFGLRTWYDVAGYGEVYFQRFQDKFIVQYDSVPWEEGYVPDTYFTYQIVLHDNGNINIYYKEVEPNSDWWGYNPLDWWTFIAIEDQTQDDGILIHEQRYKNFSYTPGSAIEFINPGLGLYTDVTNTYGSIMPGKSVTINYKIPTDSLYVAEYTETLPIITNDPVNNPLLFSVNFELTGGGAEEINISDTIVDFGDVFQFDSLAYNIVVSNTGKATDSIMSATFDKSNFKIYGDKIPEVLKPGRKLMYQVVPITDALGVFDDTLRFITKNGNEIKVRLDAQIISGPEILISPEFIIHGIVSGDRDTVQINISNNGDYDLSVAPKGNDWMSMKFPAIDQNSDTLNISYHVESSEEGNTTYDYYEIVDELNKLAGLTGWKGEQWSEPIALPFTFNFYGIDYDTIYVGFSGLITFTPDQDDFDYIFGQTYIPDESGPQNYIAPLWIQGGISNPEYYPETGQYVLIEDDRVTVEFHDYNTGFSAGEPISYQVVLYPSGNIKLQYKMPEIGQNYVTGMGTIGIENYNGTKGEMISYLNQTVNSNMSVSFYPYEEYSILPGESIDYDVELSAAELYAGSYIDSLKLYTNDPLNKNIGIYTRLVVSGTAAIELSTNTVSFGDLLVVESVDNDSGEPVYKEYIREFEIKNIGTDKFLISEFLQNKSSEVIIEAYIYTQSGPDFWEWKWIRILPDNILDPKVAPIYVYPGTTMKMRVRIAPQKAADLNDILTLKTGLGNYDITIQAQSFLPPVLNIDNSPITVYAQEPSHSEERTISIDNSNGGYPLIYDLVIEFERQEELNSVNTTSSKVGEDKTGGLQSRMLVNDTDNSISLSSLDSYNRRLSNDTNSVPVGVLGYNGGYPFYSATRFVAPEDGFNLTHVQTWFVPTSNLVSEIQVHVYGGSDNIFQCQLLYEGTYTHTIAEEDNTGELLSIPLDQGYLIYPGESFFVVFGYPIEVGYPQGYVEGLESEVNRFMFGPGDGNWYDLITAGFPEAGWFVRAVEESYIRSVWAEVLTPVQDTIPAGQSKSITIDFDANFANPGINEATLKIGSNVPGHDKEAIPLTLHRNQGPKMIATQSTFRIMEMDTLTILVEGEDVEGDSYTLTLTDGQGFATGVFSQGDMTITCTPGYADQGMKYIVINGEDEYGNVSEKSITIEVINVNREPVINELDLIEINRLYMDYYQLEESDLFVDPDGDGIIISVESDTNGIIEAFSMDNSFKLFPIELGTTTLTFTATDEYEASVSNIINIQVIEEVSSINENEFGKLNIYPNPTDGKTSVTLPEKMEGDIELSVINAIGQVVYNNKVIAANSGQLIEIDLSGLSAGIYQVRLANTQHSFQEKLIIK